MWTLASNHRGREKRTTEHTNRLEFDYGGALFMMGPYLTVSCPRCGDMAPAGLPRQMTFLTITATPISPEVFPQQLRHIMVNCPAGHEVYVYYERRFTSPSDG